ncbi:hypothetical protein [Planococcus sp. S3-L1]|uniref:hypothetical protein n=1 Tax=Planococcus sp. S3-L1 TaxID=3046200 RepID=UPI0024B94F59|nr:hypothetical protein [Planococcus sp. S3-L1]MDJ0333271.1 hypothetical protein [Planococcus sp. S3-L1]
MNKKKLTVGIVVGAVLLFVILFFANNVVGESFEKKIVGQWTVKPINGGCESDLEDGIRINDNGTIEGIDGFKKYEIEETEQEFSYLIASGGYEDITRYEISFTEDDLLVMHEEDVSEGLTCYFEKVE